MSPKGLCFQKGQGRNQIQFAFEYAPLSRIVSYCVAKDKSQIPFFYKYKKINSSSQCQLSSLHKEPSELSAEVANKRLERRHRAFNQERLEGEMRLQREYVKQYQAFRRNMDIIDLNLTNYGFKGQFAGSGVEKKAAEAEYRRKLQEKKQGERYSDAESRPMKFVMNRILSLPDKKSFDLNRSKSSQQVTRPPSTAVNLSVHPTIDPQRRLKSQGKAPAPPQFDSEQMEVRSKVMQRQSKEIVFDPKMKQMIIEMCRQEYEKELGDAGGETSYQERNVFHQSRVKDSERAELMMQISAMLSKEKGAAQGRGNQNNSQYQKCLENLSQNSGINSNVLKRGLIKSSFDRQNPIGVNAGRIQQKMQIQGRQTSGEQSQKKISRKNSNIVNKKAIVIPDQTLNYVKKGVTLFEDSFEHKGWSNQSSILLPEKKEKEFRTGETLKNASPQNKCGQKSPAESPHPQLNSIYTSSR